MNMLIIGGAGTFGSFYAKNFKEAGFNVSIMDHNCESTKKIATENCLRVLEKEDFSGFEIVIVSVPNESAPEVIQKIGKKLDKGTLLFDFCSVKSKVVDELEKLSSEELELASLHPMHSPRILSITNQPVICIPIKKGDKLEKIQKFFDEKGANFFFSTAEEHDKMLSIVQGLTHFSQFVSASVLKELEVNLKDTLKFGSPNYALFLSVIARVVLQNPELYSQIQLANPYNAKVREVFASKANELATLCNASDSEILKKYIIEETQLFKDPDAFLLEGDKAVNAFNYVTSLLKSYYNKKFLVENMLNHAFHYGKIKELTPNNLIMIEGQKETTIHLSKVRLTTKREMLEWKKRNLSPRYLDYSFIVPLEANPKIILNALNSFLRELNFELLDEYSSDDFSEKYKSLTLRAHFFEDIDKKEIDKKIKETIMGFGFILR
jgi:prephenate dehydrogenase